MVQKGHNCGPQKLQNLDTFDTLANTAWGRSVPPPLIN